MQYPKISIIIPTLNEQRYIRKCLDSILNCDYPKDSMEIFIVDGMSQDNTREIIQEYQQKYSFIFLLNNIKKIVPVAMNIGIKKASGSYIVRVDAHAIYPINYFTSLLHWSKKLDADNVGAVCLTGRSKETLTAKAIQFVMSDKFGVGNSLFRIGVEKPLEVDTVPFGFYKKEVFDDIGLYNEKLVRVQDLEFNKRLKQNGGKIYLVPDIKCTYFPRDTLGSFAKNRFNTGKWIILTAYYTKNLKRMSIRHLIPAIFVLLTIINIILGIFDNIYLKLFLVIMGIYIIILFTRAYFIKKDLSFSLNILFSYIALHFSYGVGSIKGILDVLYKKILGDKV